eukprot:7383143-Prymnesium_polylepis.1
MPVRRRAEHNLLRPRQGWELQSLLRCVRLAASTPTPHGCRLSCGALPTRICFADSLYAVFAGSPPYRCPMPVLFGPRRHHPHRHLPRWNLPQQHYIRQHHPHRHHSLAL